MHRPKPINRGLKLSGFNNLTKSLSFNLYDFCVARNDRERHAYVAYVQEHFSVAKITQVLKDVCEVIEARILAVSDQAYDPWGASSMILIGDLERGGSDSASRAVERASQVGGVSMHLDKSHICAHTYPDFRARGQVCSLRIDIAISTCGDVSPLGALNYLCRAFENDVIVMDYLVRGYTRDARGRRIYMDHTLQSIQDFIHADILGKYQRIDLALHSNNIWQTKMMRTELDEQSYFLDPVDLKSRSVQRYLDLVKKEMRGLLYMWSE